MKVYRLLAVLLVMLLSVNLFAQQKEMTKEEWQSEINRLTQRKVELTSELNALKLEVANLKKMNDALKVPDCTNEIYTMLGATKTDVDNYRKQLADLSAKIDGQVEPRADRQAELDALKKNKISALQEFFDKVENQLQKKMDAWQIKVKEEEAKRTYTVVKGDNLWGIAKKKEFYANPFAWPVIYKSNRDVIKNPDLIFPKQTFKVPVLTEDEKGKYEKLRRTYKPAPPTQSQTPAAAPAEKKAK